MSESKGFKGGMWKLEGWSDVAVETSAPPPEEKGEGEELGQQTEGKDEDVFIIRKQRVRVSSSYPPGRHVLFCFRQS